MNLPSLRATDAVRTLERARFTIEEFVDLL